MHLRFIWVGKTRDAHLRALAGEYLKRLSRFARCEVTRLHLKAHSKVIFGLGVGQAGLTAGGKDEVIDSLIH